MANVNGLLLKQPNSTTEMRLDMTPDGSGSMFRTSVVPWEVSPTLGTPWQVELMPFDAGSARTKDLNPRGLSLQLQAPADTFLPEMVVGGPLLNALALTSATTQPTKMIQAVDSSGTATFAICGRYLVRISSTYVVTTQDLGAGRVATDILQVNGDLIICCGGANAVQRRTAAGALSAGNFSAYAMAIVRDRLWRVGASGTSSFSTPTNDIGWIACLGDQSAASAMTHANWTFTTPTYKVGDTTYQCVQLFDVGGTLAGTRADGMYMPDPATKFQNITPQVYRTPDPSGLTGYGGFNAFGNFYFPYQRGLLEVRPGAAGDVGPGTAYLPLVGLRVVSGLEWDRMIYILCVDVRTNATILIKMIPDRRDIADGEWIFQPYAYIAASANYGRAMAMMSSSTNPSLVFGGGPNVTSAQYIILGRGAGRDVDDSNYRTASGSTYVTTGMFSPNIDSSMMATLVSSQVKIGVTNEAAGSTPVRVYYSAADDLMAGDNATTLMTTVSGGVTGNIVDSGVSTRYAAVGAQGTYFNMRLELVSAGSLQPTVQRWTAHGYYNPKVTDEITVRCPLQLPATTLGMRDMVNYDPDGILNQLRSWANSGTMLEAQIQGYSDDLRDAGTLVHVLISNVEQINTDGIIGPGNNAQTDAVPSVNLSLVRVDYSGSYA